MPQNNIQLLRDDLKSFQVKISHLVKDESVSASVSDLLSVARFILKSHLKANPPAPPKLAKARYYDPSDDRDDLGDSSRSLDPSRSGDSDPSSDVPDPSFDEEDLTPERQRERSKRNLREEMAGDLPSMRRKPSRPSSRSSSPSSSPSRNGHSKDPRQRIPGVNIDNTGKSGPDPENYDTVSASPKAKCALCGERVDTHPIDKNSPEDEHGDKPVIICDMTRVYCGPVE
jgi:hypothetical protein